MPLCRRRVALLVTLAVVAVAACSEALIDTPALPKVGSVVVSGPDSVEVGRTAPLSTTVFDTAGSPLFPGLTPGPRWAPTWRLSDSSLALLVVDSNQINATLVARGSGSL